MADTMRAVMHIPAKFLGFQITGGSSSTPDGYDKMRQAGAMARAVLVKAAAAQLGIAEADLKTDGGAVVAPDGTALPYIDLATTAAAINLPDDVPLKARTDWTQLGKSLPRTDMVAKVTGTAQYAGDVRLPGQLFATVRTNPKLGAGIKLSNIWAAVDVGIALDPRIIDAQVQSAIIYGLSAAIRGEITFAEGRVEQTSFPDYEPLRLHECPPIAVTILENGEKIRGIGEPGTPPAAPALANAIFALTGQRIRSLPLNREISFA